MTDDVLDLPEDYWDKQPTHEEINIANNNLEPIYYRDYYGQWWKKTSGCEYTKCGTEEDRGGWCCKHTMKDWPLRDEKDKDAKYAVCKMLQPDNACFLHKAHMAKPIQCVMSPVPKDLKFYVNGGNCTVRWVKVDGPPE